MRRNPASGFAKAIDLARAWVEEDCGAVSHTKPHASWCRFCDGGVDVMRRTFVRLLGITPRRYRELAEHSIGD